MSISLIQGAKKLSFFKFSQVSLLKKQGQTEGVCFALSLKWLLLSLSGKSDEQALRINILTEWVPQAIATQKKYVELHGNVVASVDVENSIMKKKLALLNYFAKQIGAFEVDKSNVREIFMLMDASCSNIDAIVARLRMPGTGHMLSFFYSDNTGHAMATRTRKEGLWYKIAPATFLFDPNEGEVDLDAVRLRNYLMSHMQSRQGSILMIVKMVCKT